MRVKKGSLVMWVRSDESYGHFGVVYSVTTDALNHIVECKVHWTDGQFVTYDRNESGNFLKVVKF